MLKATARLLDGPAGDVYSDLPYRQIEVIDNFMAPGGWVVECPNKPWIAEAWDSRPTGGLWMRIIDPVDPDIAHGGWVEEYDEDGTKGTITFSGMNANGMVAGLLSSPEPPTFEFPSPPRTDYAFTQPSTNTASESIYQLVYQNLGSGNLADPRYLPVSTTLAALQTIGASVELESIPFERIIDTINRWALEGGIVVDFGYDHGGVSLDMRVPSLVGFRLAEADGVLKGWRWRETGPTATHVLAAGDGEGVDRRIQDVGDYGSPFDYDGWGNVRKEVFVDSRTADANAALLEGWTVLREGQARRGVESKAILNRLGVRYKNHYQLGDIAPVIFRGVEYRQLITQVRIRWDRRGREEEIGTGQPDMAGVSLGRQAAYTIVSPTGIAVGHIRPRSLYDTDPTDVAPLEFEVVFSEGVADPGDEAEWRLEQRIDNGSWTTAIASDGIGLAEVRNEWISFDYTIPSYSQLVEVRVVLANGTTSKSSPPYLVAGVRDQLTITIPSGPYEAGLGQTVTFEIPYEMGDGSSLRVERAPVGANLWEIEPGYTANVFAFGYTLGGFSTVFYPSAGVWRWRVVTTDGYSIVESEPTSPVTVAATAGPGWFTPPTASGGVPPVVGSPVTITSANPLGDPTPTVSYQWRLDSTPISGATFASYTPIVADAGGILSVVLTATNIVGSAATTVTFGQAVTLLAAPGTPSGLTVSNNDAASVSLTWDQPIDAGVPAADSWRYRYRPAGDTAWTATITNESNPNTVVSAAVGVTGAGEGVEFEFEIQFVNENGEGPWSSTVSYTFPTAGSSPLLITDSGDALLINDSGDELLAEDP